MARLKSSIPPRVVIRIIAVGLFLLFVFIVFVWVAFLALERIGFIKSDKKDIGGSKFSVQYYRSDDLNLPNLFSTDIGNLFYAWDKFALLKTGTNL